VVPPKVIIIVKFWKKDQVGLLLKMHSSDVHRITQEPIKIADNKVPNLKFKVNIPKINVNLNFWKIKAQAI
jgi:hypothetical protein